MRKISSRTNALDILKSDKFTFLIRNYFLANTFKTLVSIRTLINMTNKQLTTRSVELA